MKFKFDPSDPRSEDEQYNSYVFSLPAHHPDRVRVEAESMPWKETARFDLAQYSEAIDALKKRGYSYAEIADWLGEKAGAKNINRGHVYRTYQQWLAAQEQEREQELRAGLVEEPPGPSITEEEAEKRAEEADSEFLKTDKTPRTKQS